MSVQPVGTDMLTLCANAQPATELVSVVHSSEIGTLVNTVCG